MTGEFPTQMASNAENVSIWWRHHGLTSFRWLSAAVTPLLAHWNYCSAKSSFSTVLTAVKPAQQACQPVEITVYLSQHISKIIMYTVPLRMNNGMTETNIITLCQYIVSNMRNIDCSVQDCSISSTLAMESLQFCTKPLICYTQEWWCIRFSKYIPIFLDIFQIQSIYGTTIWSNLAMLPFQVLTFVMFNKSSHLLTV